MTLPTIVDETTVREACRPGAWGDASSCATHEGLPLGEDGRCFWGREPSGVERLLSASLLEVVTAAEARRNRRRLGAEDERSDDLLSAATLRGAKMTDLLALAFRLNVPIPARRRPRVYRPGASAQERARAASEEGKAELADALARAIHADRVRHNPVIEEIDGRLRTVA